MIDLYLLFLAKCLTFLMLSLTLFSNKKKTDDQPKIEFINESLNKLKKTTYKKLKSLPHFKQLGKELNRNKKSVNQYDQHLFVLDFEGDIKATGVTALRAEIDLILASAKSDDLVLLRLKSGGGTVTGYGLVASQIKRLRAEGLHLTIAIDEIAASGGYLVASLANEIIAAPFACIGSIGVVYEAPNLNQFLEDKGIAYTQVTAGKYKRTLSLLGKNTPEGEKKVKEDIEMTHELFQQYITQYRELNLDEVATGETWPASIAHQKGLVDQICTSDDFINKHLSSHAILKIKTAKTTGFAKLLKSKASQLLQMIG